MIFVYVLQRRKRVYDIIILMALCGTFINIKAVYYWLSIRPLLASEQLTINDHQKWYNRAKKFYHNLWDCESIFWWHFFFIIKNIRTFHQFRESARKSKGFAKESERKKAHKLTIIILQILFNGEYIKKKDFTD